MTPINPYYKLDKLQFVHLTIGDWSEDGHGHYEKHHYEVNYPAESIQQAYKNSCEELGIQFNHNENYMGTEPKTVYDQILTEYGNNTLRPNEIKILRDANILTDQFLEYRNLVETDDHHIILTETKDVADIIMKFISYSMPNDFFYRYHQIESTPINGWWDDLNVQFGYGIFD